jgi:hypothetical protein
MVFATPSGAAMPIENRGLSARVAGASPSPEPLRAASVVESDVSVAGASPFARLLRGLAAQVEGGEALTRSAVGAASRHDDLSPAELLALQAGVCRYSEAIDLASRLVDRSTSSIKTVLQGQ